MHLPAALHAHVFEAIVVAEVDVEQEVAQCLLQTALHAHVIELLRLKALLTVLKKEAAGMPKKKVKIHGE